jgi:tRNA (cmo5U34)-methyltransferase
MAKSDNATPYSATVYDEQVRRTIPYYNVFHEETFNLIKALRLEPKLWLDTGCGTGTLAQKALPLFPNTEFILADPSPEMLKTAKGKLAGAGGRVQFLEPSDTQNLPQKSLPNPQVITAIQSHHYVSPRERAKATAVCFSLLASGGVYVTFENIRPFTSRGVAAAKENWKRFQLSQGRAPVDVEEHLQRFDVDYHPITVEEHLLLLRKAGFSTVEMLWYSCMQAGFYGVK